MTRDPVRPSSEYCSEICEVVLIVLSTCWGPNTERPSGMTKDFNCPYEPGSESATMNDTRFVSALPLETGTNGRSNWNRTSSCPGSLMSM